MDFYAQKQPSDCVMDYQPDRVEIQLLHAADYLSLGRLPEAKLLIGQAGSILDRHEASGLNGRANSVSRAELTVLRMQHSEVQEGLYAAVNNANPARFGEHIKTTLQ